MNSALQGESWTGARHTKANCHHLWGPNNAPCWTHLWADDAASSTGKEELEAHLRTFVRKSEGERKQLVLDLLKESYDPSADKWTYLVNGRCVCKPVFLLHYPISEGVLSNVQDRIKSNCESARGPPGGVQYSNDEDGGKRVAVKRETIIGWLLGYCEEVGDKVGCLIDGDNVENVIIPQMEKHTVWCEYKSCEGETAATEAYFLDVWRNAPELKHIAMARKIANFQCCKTCLKLSENIASALKAHNVVNLEKWRGKRKLHHSLQRGERICYYKRRRQGSSDQTGEECLSLILDKWDSAKTCVPFFSREPSCIGQQEKHELLQQHVLGVIIHGQPHSFYLYTFNDNLKGDANMNIEGIRRALLAHLEGGKPMPRILYVQGDNASDNKNYALFCFLALLVLYGYCEEVVLSFLLVGHVHTLLHLLVRSCILHIHCAVLMAPHYPSN